MSKKQNLYALCVGVQEYHPNASVPWLSGCEKDVELMNMILTELYSDAYDLYIENLLNEQATYENIIDYFREKHLQKNDGNSRDVILFYYSGHGSQEPAAEDFRVFFPDGQSETLVCYDSRKKIDGKIAGLDLADKELAVLLSELEQICPHTVVILDCCHSGSGTRNIYENEGAVEKIDWNAARQTSSRKEPRLLKNYLNGYYENQLKTTGKISIPKSRHILLGACANIQKAFETESKKGLFTGQLARVLSRKSKISYTELFSKTRLAMRQITTAQDPQFEISNDFDGGNNFLNFGDKKENAKYLIFHEKGEWNIDCGAVHGLSIEPGKEGTFNVFEGDRNLGTARTKSVGIQRSQINLDFSAMPGKVFNGVLTSLPTPKVLIKVEGKDTKRVLDNYEKYDSVYFEMVDQIAPGRFILKTEKDAIELWDNFRNVMIRRIEGNDDNRVFEDLFKWSEHLAEWEKALTIQNSNTEFNPDKLNFYLTVYDENNDPTTLPGDEATVTTTKDGTEFRSVRFDLKIENKCGQELHCSLFYFSPAYGLHFVEYVKIPNGEKALYMQDQHFELYGEETESVELLKVFVGTEKTDDFLLQMEEQDVGETVRYNKTREILGGQKGIGGFSKPKKKVIENDWFTKTLRVEIMGK